MRDERFHHCTILVPRVALNLYFYGDLMLLNIEIMLLNVDVIKF